MLPAQFTTANLELRPFFPQDAVAVFEYWSSDPGGGRYNASVPRDFTLGDAEAFVARMSPRDRETSPNWALLYKLEVIGVVSVQFVQEMRIAIIGYGVHKRVRGRGFSVEAAAAVIDEAFRVQVELQKFRAHTDPDNLSSQRVLSKLGFKLEGTLRCNQWVKGELVDEAIYGLLREEWLSKKFS